MKKYKILHNRLIDITYQKQLSHISSCVTTLPILYDIYENKNDNDIVILSNGHAGLAQYVCMEYFENKDAVYLFDKFGVHPEKSLSDGIFATTGSLGLGLPIALGAAMADPDRNVHCIISDGECCEGSIWECLYFLSKNPLYNLYIYVNLNGFSAYSKVDITKLSNTIRAFGVSRIKLVNTSDILRNYTLLNTKAIEAHYIKIKNQEELNQLKYEINDI